MTFSIPQNYDILESVAVDRAREFLRPRSPAETLQVVLVVLWFLMVMLVGPNELQYYLFLITILSIYYTAIVSFYRKEISRSIAGSALRFGIFVWLYIVLQGIGVVESQYIQMQVYILSLTFLLGLLTRQVKLDLLSSHKIDDYWDFVGGLLTGIAQLGLFTLILYHINNLPSYFNTNPISLTISTPPIQVTILAVILLVSVSCYILAGLSPQSVSKQRILTAQSLVLLPTTRVERFRTSALIAGFLLILISYLHIFDNELRIATSSTTTSNSLEFFKNLGAVLFVLGLIMFIFGSAFTGKRKKTLKDYATALQTNNPFKNQLADIKSAVENVTITSENQKFYKLKADTPIPLGSTSQNTFLVKKDAIAIPVAETSEGTTMIIVGDSETIASNKQMTKNSGATTMIVPKRKWNTVSEQLEPIVPSDTLIQSLKMQGIESKEKLVTLANQALDGLKKWQGPTEMLSKFQTEQLLESIQSGRYGITSNKDFSRVRLPGITVIDTPQIEYVYILGLIKVLELPSLDLTGVDLPFVKVLQRGDYDFVQLPFITVLDTSEGELVKLGGLTFTDGNKNAIESGIQRALTEQSAFTKLIGGSLDNIFADPDKTLIFTQSLTGEPKLLMENGQEAIIKYNKQSIAKDIKHSIKNDIKESITRDTKSTEHKERVKVASTKKMIVSSSSLQDEPNHPDTQPISNQVVSTSASPKKLVIDSEGIDHYPICPMCKENITSGGIKCPHCDTLFHKSHYLPWVRDTGQCYKCKNAIELEFK